ncbi:hypothetical protein IQ229_01115 [Nostoc cf. edaphicum LEGE 07299]|uniref:Uncharacterized protein n=1 Tax=Nostoc cf. edaphicum LEGE 07299 TaxID=2777974 RepID=A0ABR9TUU2_9NOSO|nr:hypothetical protein [Nostoc edaphicum]MBE9103592.1 hypothetical protein [Nostoc cf. edaphicum LEGE 07299]
MSYQIKKHVETLSEIQRKILTVQPENDEAANCLNGAYAGITQAIESLEKLQDVLLEAAIDAYDNPKEERNKL